jgi:hypothetical protein
MNAFGTALELEAVVLDAPCDILADADIGRCSPGAP